MKAADAGDVADRPEPLPRPAPVVNGDRPRLFVKSDAPDPDARQGRPGAGGNEELLGLQAFAARELNYETESALSRRTDLRSRHDAHSLAPEHLCEQLTRLRLFGSEQVRADLDDGHGASEAGKYLSELDPDRSPAETTRDEGTSVASIASRLVQ